MKAVGEFKKFIMRGNVVDMAVGVIVGGAFGKIVTSLVNDIIMPPIGLLLGGINFTELAVKLKDAVIDPETGAVTSEAVSINYGTFAQTVLDFLLVSLCIFVFVKIVGAIRSKFERKQAEEPTPPKGPTTEELLTEIRDLLAKK